MSILKIGGILVGSLDESTFTKTVFDANECIIMRGVPVPYRGLGHARLQCGRFNQRYHREPTRALCGIQPAMKTKRELARIVRHATLEIEKDQPEPVVVAKKPLRCAHVTEHGVYVY